MVVIPDIDVGAVHHIADRDIDAATDIDAVQLALTFMLCDGAC